MENEAVSKNFIEQIIDKDLAEGHCKTVHTRFPPEPNGYLHIGHAKSILLNYGLAQEYNGLFNMRFDDTNPTKERSEFVESIKEDIKWLGADWGDRLFFASNYFDQMYEAAVKLIKKGKAYVSDLSAEEMREYRGTLKEPGKEDPSAGRSVEENLELFEAMKDGRYADGEKVLRARIDMASPNMNMRDPVIYRVAHMTHQNTGDKWCIYPMYDFAHPIEDAIEGITHSICTLEFEDHRPLYDWVVRELEYENPPKQIEFAKLYLTNVVTGKRYIKKLVEEHIVDGWDDPRLVSIAALRRRGFTPESIKMFVELCGVSKANSSVDYAMLEYCIREDLKLKRSRVMAVLDPIKVIIDNYPEDQIEYFDVVNNMENETLGSRKVPFARELYIDREDFMEEPPRKYFRMFPGNEVRLMHAYFVKCNSFVKDENGKVTEIHCTYDPESRGGNSPDGRKVKGTIHWVAAPTAVKAEVRLYENIVDEELGVYNEDGSLNLNPNSLTVLKECYVEPGLADAKGYDSFQFVRQGYFCVDAKDSKEDALVFNRIVSLKSSYKLPAQQ
ncbi:MULTISPECIES: glutamine--tRNA ligase/YqeY domain fusion protein [unclassified Roseburia]|jgi:glutaminyl-tRNA synthetase|uniref:glutamine--tRNA ligase/YqeY domain fusion protein n=1 Tax=unclassified Roseburia TaxID=2637578 RepID=UPI000E489944|nr:MULTISPECIES: glutamine--tRNA ligase/YqeY domain fusion protein [unclassified Roseburia]HBM01138.1 glutamine--tRNA ligase [Roseburia sp.]RHQ39264.1 glutamine--tRNA ligase/YqeY domain fusion protein [Roseburia sp. AF25-25LB]RHQ44302.1 glutamine--tRNA ligase/YqeY domain fusion protein [Roseburia sp. AF25-18LB]RHQ51473.1 glutamine--tRNA ligase/YqeY domain fusion protein [Roseburia sp. AF25-15LB]RHQ52635.1 glutamine--tRNA ligase/YqeY domain fusion protein [Roseburia sp. AF25-13LB]